MSEPFRIYEWPRAGAQTFVWAVVLVLCLFACAVFIEVFRRRSQRRLRLAAEWEVVRQIAAQRDLSKAEWSVLEQLIRRHAPEAPHRAVTVRQQFDVCIERDLEEVQRLNDTEAFAGRGILLRDLRTQLGLDYIPFGQRIHSTRELYLDQIILIAGPGEGVARHRMKVSSVDEAYFRLVPESPGEAPAFRPGDELRFRMWREQDGRYVFSAKVAAIEEAPRTWVFAHAQELRRTQARAHFRIGYDQNAEISIVAAPRGDDVNDLDLRPVITRLRGRVTSLSGGGASVVVPQPLPNQVLLRFFLDIGNQDLQVAMRPVAVTPLFGGQYLARGPFFFADEETQDLITHFVFKRQQQHGIAGSTNEADVE